MLMCKGYKLADGTTANWDDPGAVIEIVPLSRGEPQPIYHQPDAFQRAFG
jgi:hypothetical protein